MSCFELMRRQSFIGDGHIARGTGISRNEPHWELWKRLHHKDILAAQPQSHDSDVWCFLVGVSSWCDIRTMPSELVHPSYTETVLFKDKSLCVERSRDSPELGIADILFTVHKGAPFRR